MRYIVGVDSRARCPGALRFCRWVLEPSRGTADDRVEAVHVLQDGDLRSMRAHVSLSEIERMAREAFDAALARDGLTDRVAAADLVFDTTAERALSQRASAASDAVLVIGRKAPRGSMAWTRLGRTARRLARELPAPVVVVPPDYTPPTDATAPVLLATNLHHDGDGAARFAARVAAQWARPLLVVHVVPGIPAIPPTYLPAHAHEQVVADGERVGREDLALWLRRHDLSRAEAVVVTGDAVDRVAELAQQRHAALVVVGSRMLPLRSRLYQSSVGSDLAGSATVPVAIVPPSE